MKLLASGDHHFDQHSRLEECVAVHQWMVDLAREERVDLFLSGGDIYERASTPVERDAVAEWLTRVAEVCPVVIAKGNHDRPLDCAILSRLRTRHPVIVEERAAVHYVAGAAVATMAWPERAGLLAVLDDQGAADNAVRGCLQAVLRGLGDQLAQHDGPRILCGHFMVDGAITSTNQPLLGQPINVGLADLALAQAHLGIMGHIHKSQRFDVGGAPHVYPGSPFRTDFGQLEKKVVNLAEFEGQQLVSLIDIETPATPMVHLDLTWANGGVLLLDCGRQPHENELAAIASGAEVRVRYRVERDQREQARAAVLEMRDTLVALGALSVKVEEQLIIETRARTPEVARATTLPEKLSAFWESKGFEPGARREPLLEKLSTVEEEARNDVA